MNFLKYEIFKNLSDVQNYVTSYFIDVYIFYLLFNKKNCLYEGSLIKIFT